MKKIAVAAATGNLGKRVAQQISLQGAETVLLGQNLERLTQLNISNSTPAVADLSNREQMIEATKGVDALFILVPPVLNTTSLEEWYHQVTDAGIAAVNANKIKKVVLISSLGASTTPNLATVSYCGAMEVAFDKLSTNILALRPGYFMENFVQQAKSIMKDGKFSFPFDGDHDIPFISTDDIGDAAAHYLLDETWAGHWKLNLMGPENITLKDAAARLTTLTNKPIEYVQQSFDELKAQLKTLGITDKVLQELVDLHNALGDPNGAYATPRTPEVSTSTSFEQFAKQKLLPLL
ncbi:NAD(P)H-binding protein [Chryseobacterium wangxinyae]|uniref:NmrA family NAD(P)-binding protein n=1 Tax=Chryseobacterium sp. CY350 TaxID=2997336 RepID=UPI00226E1030|nr:NAD(P)H-binding protein [Chryseobacterium sp. CY350]MCY0977216.1 NAD(P)H-binding protein [Chryseobacterium sp. CY350]WBZ95763.1 NAD(P)H-binding protein [Chryseobacterium sp. CY350]